MQNRLPKLLTLAAVGATCMFSACSQEGQNQIVLLRSYVTTNQIPGYIDDPDIKPQVDSNGWLELPTMPAVAIKHPPRTEVVTNYVLGYRQGTHTVELLTAEKR